MKAPIVIGVTGYKGSGKGEVAKALKEKHGFAVVKFAGALKAMMYALGLTEYDIEGEGKEAPNVLLCGQTPRHAMQTLGTEWGRGCIGEQFWVNVAMTTARRRLMAAESVVIDDVRFPNEAEAIKRMGGMMIRVIRPDNVIDLRHPSEQFIGSLRTDETIVNDGSIEGLRSAVDNVLSLRGLL